MNQITRIGVDTSKSVFQLHGVDERDQPVLLKKLRRQQVLNFFGRLAPTKIGIEACGASHHWARSLRELGHEVVLLPPQYVKPYVMRGKNDAADAEAICEAMSRPKMRFVAIKSVEQQAAQMLLGVRDGLLRRRTQVSNQIRGYAAEFGLTAARGLARIEALLAEVADDASLPGLAQEMFIMLSGQYRHVNAQIQEIESKLKALHLSDEQSRRLAEIPTIGLITATALSAKVADPKAFRSGRDFAAWLGLTPKNHSTAGKVRLGGITRAGDEMLRCLLVSGATAVIRQAKLGKGYISAWLAALLQRSPPKLAAVALANKMARIAWKLMVSGERYNPLKATTVAVSA
jgi:transposase